MNSAHPPVQLVLFVQLVQLVLFVQLVPLAKAHKILVFVLGKPENGGPEGQKRTKTPILCSKCPKTGVPKGKKAQKCRFCAREDGYWHQGEGKLASGSATVAFLQITAHTSKI